MISATRFLASPCPDADDGMDVDSGDQLRGRRRRDQRGAAGRLGWWHGHGVERCVMHDPTPAPPSLGVVAAVVGHGEEDAVAEVPTASGSVQLRREGEILAVLSLRRRASPRGCGGRMEATFCAPAR